MAVTEAALGTGDNTALIYQRGGTRPLFEVPGVAKLEWGRALDAVSRSTIDTTAAGATKRSQKWADCCSALAQVQPWAHEVVVFRSGERVWEGPVRRVVQSRSGVQIVASDVLGWTERRVQTSPALGTVSLTTFAAAIYTTAFTNPILVPNVLPYVTRGGDASRTTDLDVKAGGYWSALLDTLVSAGWSYTTVGRRILHWDDPAYTPGVTAILNPSRHLVGDVEIAREGDELATTAYAVNDDGEIGSATTGDTYYGGVERSFTAAGIVGTAALNAAAAAWLALRYPLPQSLSIPDGSTLHCDAPFPMAALVPGSLTPVKVTDMCWSVEQTMMLTAVKVTQDAGGEKVGVTYAPITGDEAP